MSEGGETEPIIFRWKGGDVALGYLGRLRWRTRHSDAVVEVGHARAAAALVLDQMFDGTTPGREAAERAPVHVEIAGDVSTLDVDTRMANGWSYSSATSRFDLGPHDALLPFVADLLARSADAAWAVGVEPQRPTPLGRQFSFKAFANAADRNALCNGLAAALTQRLRHSEYPPTAFVSAMQELKELRHDLWSWEPDQAWGTITSLAVPAWACSSPDLAATKTKKPPPKRQSWSSSALSPEVRLSRARQHAVKRG